MEDVLFEREIGDGGAWSQVCIAYLQRVEDYIEQHLQDIQYLTGGDHSGNPPTEKTAQAGRLSGFFCEVWKTLPNSG